MGVIGAIYANVLLSIADISVRLFAPPSEDVPVPVHRSGYDEESMESAGRLHRLGLSVA